MICIDPFISNIERIRNEIEKKNTALCVFFVAKRILPLQPEIEEQHQEPAPSPSPRPSSVASPEVAVAPRYKKRRAPRPPTFDGSGLDDALANQSATGLSQSVPALSSAGLVAVELELEGTEVRAEKEPKKETRRTHHSSVSRFAFSENQKQSQLTCTNITYDTLLNFVEREVNMKKA